VDTAVNLLSVRDLYVSFETPEGVVEAVRGVSFDVPAASVVAIAGESGSGKSVCVESIMGLLSNSATVSGDILYKGENLRSLSASKMRHVRGAEIAMVFQDAMTSLDPVIRIHSQIREALVAHGRMTRSEAMKRSVALLDAVGIPDPERTLRSYPHELSGGMQQRVMVAMAISNNPSILIADEATTALDVTVQAQILRLLASVTKERGASMVMIAHDLGVVAGLAEYVLIMYAGTVVEAGPTREVFYQPQHPYTAGLLAATPDVQRATPDRLDTIPGTPPDPTDLPVGCAFELRCPHAQAICKETAPEARTVLGDDTRLSRCHLSDELQLTAPHKPREPL